MKRLFKIIIVPVIIVLVAFVGFVVYLTITKYEPKSTEILFAGEGDVVQLSDSTEYGILIWNTAYSGLDKSMDFFYDGGEEVRPEESQSRSNLTSIKSMIKDIGQSVDFILLQEVDRDAKRSYYSNQVDVFSKLFSSRNSQFALNYNVRFVPLPVSDPMGRVESGLQLISKFQPKKTVRNAYPSNFRFPKNLVMLQRCFLVNRYATQDGKELLVINTHNSAYDDGSLRKDEMDFLRDFLSEEYQKGNYLVVGGDWNQCPPNFKHQYTKDVFDDVNRIDISSDCLSDWKWAFDASVPTNRRVTKPYVQGESLTTVIDFFLLSPNLDLIEVRGHDLDFEFSDHNPVSLRFKMK